MRECRLIRYASGSSPEQCTPPGTWLCTFSVEVCWAISPNSSANAASRPRGQGQKYECDMGYPLSVEIQELSCSTTGNFSAAHDECHFEVHLPQSVARSQSHSAIKRCGETLTRPTANYFANARSTKSSRSCPQKPSPSNTYHGEPNTFAAIASSVKRPYSV